MAGYSGTPLGKKLGIKPGQAVLLQGAPPSFEAELRPLPAEVCVCRRRTAGWSFDVILTFCKNRRALHDHLDRCLDRLVADGGLWLCWPTKSSGVMTDIAEAQVRAAGLAAGLVDNKICAVTEIWSGLRFVVRVKDRAGWASR